MKSFQLYPQELEHEEAVAVRRRRQAVSGPGTDPLGPQPAGPDAPVAPAPPDDAASDDPRGPPRQLESLPPDSIGLCLSGGGIRSATFCLGVIQAFAQRGLLRHFDFLSTVSGGGYTGAFLGRFYDRLRASPALAADVVEGAVANAASAPIRWLRDHGEFIAPAGKGDLKIGLAVFLRNVVTLYLVLGLMLFALWGLANWVRYGALNPLASLVPYVAAFSWVRMPLGRLVQAADLGVFWSPWFVLIELLLLLRVVPTGLAYWLVSQDEDEAYSPPALCFTFITLLVLLYLGAARGLNVPALGGAAAVLLAFVDAERAWRRVRLVTAAVGSGGPRVKQLRARLALSLNLGVWLGVVGWLTYLAVIDTAAFALYEAHGRRNEAFARTLAWLVGGVAALLPIVRGAARLLAARPATPGGAGGGGFVSRLLGSPIANAAVALLLTALPLLLVAFLSHASFGSGSTVGRGAAAGLLALALSLVVALPWSVMLINRSSLQATYAARLARAFLGASNPASGAVGSGFMTPAADDVLPGDDVDVLTDYRPHEAGGPVHLINVCVNQTIDPDTLRSARQRQGIGMACTALGTSIGRFYHARWNPAYRRARRAWHTRLPGRPAPNGGPPLWPVGHVPGTLHPLLGADGAPPDDVQLLPLRDWVAISGAAFGPGRGAQTTPMLAILAVLGNARIGFWWDSGLSAADRGRRPTVSFTRRLLWQLPRLFQTQTRLLAEAGARFRGPWDRLWYLSDGGHFEMLGAYELVRRRVRYIVALDAGGDFADFAAFQRIVRIDFQAEVAHLGKAEWDAAVARHLGTISDPELRQRAANDWAARAERVAVAPGEGGPFDPLLVAGRPRPGAVLRKHAALLKITYPRGAPSYMLYASASLSGDEPLDVAHYRASHPDFPNQSTLDQFFDEPQWESYRGLGEHVGEGLLGERPKEPPTTTTPRDLWLTWFGRE